MKTIPTKLGRYNILQEVGRGSMGVVYKASDPVIEREVAIKAIQLAFNVTSEEKQIYLSRFYREAKAAGKLNHPNIVTIYDVNEDKETGTPFIVMEYLEGTTLQEIIADGILLPLEDVNSIIIQIADALNYAHKQGVVHRDVKSANIMLVEGMKPKITDFGIARMSTSDLTKSGQFMGTPNYMSPEQIDGKVPVDGRSDLFALGVIFYLLLTGERPFSGDSFTSISYKIVHVDPLPPRTLNPAVPDSYNRIVNRLLAKDPNERYKTGADLIVDMRAIDQPSPSRATDAPMPTVAGGSAAPPKVADDLKATDQGGRESIASALTVPSGTSTGTPGKQRQHRRRIIALVAAALVLIGTWSFFVYYESGPEQRMVPISHPGGAAPPSESTQTPVQAPAGRPPKLQAKLDLALNYYRNGFYSQSIELFNEVLHLDPQNPEATRYLQLAQEKVRKSESRKKVEESSKKSSLPPPSGTPARPPAPDGGTRPKIAKAATSQSPVKAAPAAKDSRIEFELDHPFPSGSFSIYLGEELLYKGALSAKESRKMLLVPIRAGRLTGSLPAPAGRVELRMQISCSEQGVSAEKKSTVNLQKGGTARARIKYVTVSKQLEIKWL